MDELWSTDYEVLYWVVERFEHAGHPIQSDEVLAASAEDRRGAVQQSLRRLASHGYIEGAMTGGGLGARQLDVLRITGVTERALRAVGAWPDNADLLADRILAVLAERAENEPEPENAVQVQGRAQRIRHDDARLVRGGRWIGHRQVSGAGLTCRAVARPTVNQSR